MIPITKQFRLILIFVFSLYITASGQVKLPKLISNGMVLQRDVNVKIWGWAANHEKVTIHFNDSIYQTIANDSGKWEVKLSKLKAGGPYSMTINATNTINLKDILIGDVWVCSGQSNMELPMKRVSPIYENEIATSENTYIRNFTVPQKYNFKTPQVDFESGSWQIANPKNVLNFSAVD